MQNIDALTLLSKQITFDQGSAPVLEQALRIAIYDEYRAFETYKVVIATHNVKAPFVNIMQAEIKHYEQLVAMCQKYEITPPINDIAGGISAPKTLQECYELGVAYEIENVYMYDYLIPFVSDYPDVVDSFYKLQAASYNNHLPMLRMHVANSGVNQEDVMAKINEFSQIAGKLASGEADPNEITKLLSQTNISLITGLLAGGVGGVALNQFFTKQDNEEK